MPFLSSDDIQSSIKYLTRHLNAEMLKSAINEAKEDYIVMPSQYSLLEEVLLPRWLILGPFSWAAFVGYRSIKLWLRSLPNDMTDRNAKQILLKILNGPGNADKKSYKWTLVYMLLDQIKYRLAAQSMSGSSVERFLSMTQGGWHYTDRDVEGYIEEIKLNLVGSNKIPNQIVMILDRFIERNTSIFSRQESEEVCNVRLIRHQIVENIIKNLEPDLISDDNNVQLDEMGGETLSKLKEFLIIEENNLSPAAQNDLRALCDRLKAYLDDRFTSAHQLDLGARISNRN